VYRITAGTVGGPLLLIQGNYNAQTGDFPPDITGITLAGWTVDSCAGIWSLIGASATDPVGTVTLDGLTITHVDRRQLRAVRVQPRRRGRDRRRYAGEAVILAGARRR
jgi:hypothetical protein